MVCKTNDKEKSANRGERLKAALRENLRRRKERARGRDATPASTENDEPAPEDKNER